MHLEEQKEITKCIQMISDEIDSDIFIFNASITESNGDKLIDIVRRVSPKRANVALILTTYGGEPNAAYRIARYLKRTYKKFTLFVFGYCKSAGTLLALGADEIVMSDFGEMGPLDIQVVKDDDFRGGRSGLDIHQALDVIGGQSFKMFEHYFTAVISGSQATITTKTAADIASSMAVGLLSPICSQIDPLRLGEMNRLMAIALAYGERLQPEKIEIIALLTSGYPSHDFVIDYTEAKELFECVREPKNSEYALERLMLPIVRKPYLQEVIGNLREMIKEHEDEDESNGNSQGTTERTLQADNGKSEAIE